MRIADCGLRNGKSAGRGAWHARTAHFALRTPHCPRRGLTLIELLISLSMMAMLAGVLAGLAMAVQTSTAYSYGHATATQHARVVLERIARDVSQASGAGEHAAFAVITHVDGAYRFPDTLVIWRPTGAPANPQGPPLVKELVIYTPDPADPRQLLEIRAPGDSRSVPLNDQINQSPWREVIEEVKTSSSSRKVVLTNLLRSPTTLVGGAAVNAPPATRRGAVRFEQELRPSATAWAAYKGGTLTWDSLIWPQGLGGSLCGLRQSWLRVELQLMPGEDALARDVQGEQAIPFYSSSAAYYSLSR
jgi:prepilin-type N-terminal cleavage/methylation domain-containing protein